MDRAKRQEPDPDDAVQLLADCRLTVAVGCAEGAWGVEHRFLRQQAEVLPSSGIAWMTSSSPLSMSATATN